MGPSLCSLYGDINVEISRGRGVHGGQGYRRDFLNFILDEEVRSFCGVGFYNVSNEEDLERGRIGW